MCLKVDGSTDTFSLHGHNAVTELYLGGRACLGTLANFTNLISLRMGFAQTEPSVVDLSVCTTLRKVRITGQGYGDSQLEGIILTGCSLIETLHFENIAALEELDLSPCTALTDLVCIRSSVHTLDVSCCPLLTSLDVTGSLELQRMIRNPNSLMHIASEGCPQLSTA